MPEISMQARFRPADDVVFRTVDGEAVILSIRSGLYFGLTPVGTRIWELMDDGRALDEILATLRLEYDGGEDEMKRDLETLVSGSRRGGSSARLPTRPAEAALSGIYGLVRHDGAPIAGTVVGAMGRTLVRRGPHASGELVSGPVGLGHRLLRTTPEAEREAQPFADRGLAVVADVRLDYRDDLMRALALPADPERPVGDAELLLRAYERWGDDCVDRLFGDFAFVIWDAPRRQLFCARDHFGARPFLYASTPAVFAFGSEAKAILEVPEIPRVLNEARVGDFLVGGFQEGFDTTVTFFRDVFRLPPAHRLVVSGGRIDIRRYWSVGATRGARTLSLDDAVDGFRERFVGAVRERLRGGRAVGAMLSGGVDSSSIVAFAAPIRRDRGELPLETFSCVDEDGSPSLESDFIRLAARMIPGVRPTFIRPRDIAGLAGAFDDLASTLDEPFDLMAVNLLVYRAARDAGLSVVLDGCDGDLVASRHGAMRFALQTGRWRLAWREAQNRARWGRSSPLRTFLAEGVRPVLRGVVARATWLERHRNTLRRRLRPFPTTAATGYIRRSFADRIDIEGRHRQVLDRMFPPGWSRATPDEAYAHWLGSGLIPAALERYDRVAASQSIEPRHPFLDVKLVSFYLGVPWDSPANEGLPKAILRRAAEGHLPAELCGRFFDPPLYVTVNDRLTDLKRADFWEMLVAGGRIDRYVDVDAMRVSDSRSSDVGARPERQWAIARIALLDAWLGRLSPHR